jgi:hypothetical protein
MNAGAILNRINFGMAVAANRIPGARINEVPGLDTLGNAPRAKQVDAVVGLMLGGSISPDTRAVLMSGENPLASGAAASPAATDMSAQPANEDMMQQQAQRPNARNVAQNRRIAGQQGQQRPQGNPLAGRNGPVPQLNGIAQVVGLALGSPEFQRH